MVQTAGDTGDQRAKLKDQQFGVCTNVVVVYARQKQWTPSAELDELDEGFSSLGYYLSHMAATACENPTPSFSPTDYCSARRVSRCSVVVENQSTQSTFVGSKAVDNKE